MKAEDNQTMRQSDNQNTPAARLAALEEQRRRVVADPYAARNTRSDKLAEIDREIALIRHRQALAAGH